MAGPVGEGLIESCCLKPVEGLRAGDELDYTVELALIYLLVMKQELEVGLLPWQAHSSQEFSHPTGYIDYIPQCIGLCVAHASRIAHLAQQLRHHIVCSFDFTC